MKVNVVKTANGKLWPAEQEDEEKLRNMKVAEVYEVDIKVNQNYQLHKKIFAFFKFCTQHYYGDMDVTTEQVEFTREKLLMSAGYVKQVFYPDGQRFELKPMSMSYAKMSPEERSECYKRLINTALKRVFNNNIDKVTENQLMSFF